MADPAFVTFGEDHGLDEATIARVIRAFYEAAREDALLGPIFRREVEDWDHHLATIVDFWSGLLLRTTRYEGRPLRPHLRMPLRGAHFDRWLSLFEATAREICTEAGAAAFIGRARRIADSFEMAVASQQGLLSAPRHADRGNAA